MEPFDVGLLILRLVAGTVMIAHGINQTPGGKRLKGGGGAVPYLWAFE